jgi:hypothetical protein
VFLGFCDTSVRVRDNAQFFFCFGQNGCVLQLGPNPLFFHKSVLFSLSILSIILLFGGLFHLGHSPANERISPKTATRTLIKRERKETKLLQELYPLFVMHRSTFRGNPLEKYFFQKRIKIKVIIIKKELQMSQKIIYFYTIILLKLTLSKSNVQHILTSSHP